MATAQKKKTTVKKLSVKAAAAKSSAKQTYGASARSARPAAAAWTKPEAKLYQFPGDMEAAGKQAAEGMKAAADNMMRMGGEAMQQLFGSMQIGGQKPEAMFEKFKAQAGDVFGHAIPKFNPADMQEKLSKFAREAAEQMARSTSGSTHAANEAAALSRENLAALVEVLNVATTLFKELGADSVSYANKSFAHNVELSKEALKCRTLNDMFDLGGRFMKSNLDSFFSQSVKFSEKLFQTATEVSDPLNERLSESAERLSKAMAA